MVLENSRLDLSAVTIPFSKIIAHFFLFCSPFFNLGNYTGALKWPPPSQMHELPKPFKLIKALLIHRYLLLPTLFLKTNSSLNVLHYELKHRAFSPDPLHCSPAF